MTWNLMGTLTGTSGVTGSETWKGAGNAIGAYSVSGTFGGGTVTLEFSNDGGATFFIIEDSSLTQSGVRTFVLPGGQVMDIEDHCKVRARLTGASGANIVIRLGTQDQR